MSDKNENTNNLLLKDKLRCLIEDNLGLLCHDLSSTFAHQWVCVILLMQFIEYLLKYRIQSYGTEFYQKGRNAGHNFKKLYKLLRCEDQKCIEARFSELIRDQTRGPKSFRTIKEFANRYFNSYTLLRYDIFEENFSTKVRYFYIADTFLVLIALMECSDIDFDICKARDMQKAMVKRFDKLDKRKKK